ncbi:hypothetical protein [uncultured Ruminococcus sp.]|uniref:hypothetical protein n=1 Tax=uncultured Ruminococcus sp. TaxID=165186 RepID=UPI0025FA2AC5|nr:hypothetical protein [uncultured Ruminococcus sp.]
MDIIKKICAASLALCLAASLAGCGSEITENAPAPKLNKETTAEEDSAEEVPVETTAETTTTAAPESAAEEKPEETKKDMKYIGEADETKSSYSVELTNGTDKDIISVAVRYNNSDFSENIIPGGEDFKAEETRLFNWTNDITGDVMTLGDYDLEITFEDEETFILHGFPLTDMISGEIRLMDEYAFVVYTNKIGDSKDTRQKEANIAEEERIAKEKEEAEKNTTTTTTTAAPETEAPVETTQETQQTEAPVENVW